MAKAYTVKAGQIYPGIQLNKEGKIEVGEAGRGRKLVLAPTPPGAKIEVDRMVEAPAKEGERACIVHLLDCSGYRGGWSLQPARDPQARRAQREHADPLGQDHDRAQCPTCSTWDAAKVPAGRIIAEGRCAQGDAGGMGGGPEYLMVLPEGESVEVRRSGRLYGAPVLWRISNVGGVVTATDVEAEQATLKAEVAW